MDEFYQEINAIFYLKWIMLQGKKYNLQTKYADRKQTVVIVKNNAVEGKIIYYGDGIFEQELIDCQNPKKIFYLHVMIINLYKQLLIELLNLIKMV